LYSRVACDLTIWIAEPMHMLNSMSILSWAREYHDSEQLAHRVDRRQHDDTDKHGG
jgi:hypothetical protein